MKQHIATAVTGVVPRPGRSIEPVRARVVPDCVGSGPGCGNFVPRYRPQV
ncbi:hypothetical protein CORC01_00592 [Colletotrichum orchidophilum]|uniref:Uncharacterized protein n=1 Tax=Colletotrichum orchidophilum TaxID=1209926 RepID=A0A1G4BSB5_9PEZI|nr:uncharacterized protein CORC01_00592 [Colletotrichum orchidophilum]OHF04253.1 hypothetical protein CORC01_00592 [Colletotrichum orchidophilum]